MKKLNAAFLIALIVATFISCKKDDVKSKQTVVYETDFSSDDGHWYRGTTSNNTVISINNGYYTFNSGAAGGWAAWLTPVFNSAIGNAGIEASVKLATTGPATWGNGALLWNVRGSNNTGDFTAKTFYISHNGYYTIAALYEDGSRETFVDWTLNSSIKQGQFNILKILSKNDKLHFYINNQEVYNMNDASGFVTLDKVGLEVSKYTNMQVDYFKATTF
ncbi:MAG: hypothetical protein QM594_02905 [Niabella sp.]